MVTFKKKLAFSLINIFLVIILFVFSFILLNLNQKIQNSFAAVQISCKSNVLLTQDTSGTTRQVVCSDEGKVCKTTGTSASCVLPSSDADCRSLKGSNYSYNSNTNQCTITKTACSELEIKGCGKQICLVTENGQPACIPRSEGFCSNSQAVYHRDSGKKIEVCPLPTKCFDLENKDGNLEARCLNAYCKDDKTVLDKNGNTITCQSGTKCVETKDSASCTTDSSCNNLTSCIAKIGNKCLAGFEEGGCKTSGKNCKVKVETNTESVDIGTEVKCNTTPTQTTPAPTPTPTPATTTQSKSCKFSQEIEGKVKCFTGAITDPNKATGFNLNCSYKEGVTTETACPGDKCQAENPNCGSGFHCEEDIQGTVSCKPDKSVANLTECKDNPVTPQSGYTWHAFCKRTCTKDAECSVNDFDPSNVNAKDSAWCYGFKEGGRCLQLRSVNSPRSPQGNVSARNNPVDPPETEPKDGFEYEWVTDMNSTCGANDQCPANHDEPFRVDPKTSNWCFGFDDRPRCMMLKSKNLSASKESNLANLNYCSNVVRT